MTVARCWTRDIGSTVKEQCRKSKVESKHKTRVYVRIRGRDSCSLEVRLLSSGRELVFTDTNSCDQHESRRTLHNLGFLTSTNTFHEYEKRVCDGKIAG